MTRTTLCRSAAVCAVLLAAWPMDVQAQIQAPSPAVSASEHPANPGQANLSREKLARIGVYMRNEIATGKIPGAIVLVQQHGQVVYRENFGAMDTTAKRPMMPDAIFRLYSMSKPITSVAAMMLIDRGQLSLADPVSKYIPAFTDVKVGIEHSDENGKPALRLEPLRRPITVEDLLRHTSGLTYGFYGEGAVRKLYAGSDLFEGDFSNADFVARLAKLPLAEQPGTRWDYGHSVDVLGRVVEVVSGQSLFQFEKQNLLEPLGMSETSFYIADAAKYQRLAEPLPDDRFASPVAGIAEPPTVPRRWESGGAGMVGTLDDYARFAQMLLNGGALDGKRYLKTETVALMASDHIGSQTGIAHDQFFYPGDGGGFGLGFAVRLTTADHSLSPPGEYSWDGVAGTFFFIDPKDDLLAICMMQSPSQRGRIEGDLRRLVYEARE